jgi:hypothetical protein
MIPWNLRLKVKRDGGGVNLWIPLVVVWILLLPPAILVFIAWLILRIVGSANPEAAGAARIIAASAVVLWRLGGLKVKVRSAESDVTFRFW